MANIRHPLLPFLHNHIPALATVSKKGGGIIPNHISLASMVALVGAGPISSYRLACR